MFWRSVPREKGSTVTSVVPCATDLGVSLPIWLNCITLWTFFTLPLFLTMFSTKVLSDPSEVPKSPWRFMMYACWLWAHVYFLPYHIFVSSLLQLPWQIMASSMKLKILISLETFVADLTHKSIACQQAFWRQGYYFSIWVYIYIQNITKKYSIIIIYKEYKKEFGLWDLDFLEDFSSSY